MDKAPDAATMDDFRGLEKGAQVRIYAEMKGYEASTWVHDHVERDLIFGELHLDDGPVLPTDAYLYDGGESVSFSYGSQLDRPGGFALFGGTVYLHPPSPDRSAPAAARGALNRGERRRFDTLVDRYAAMGFEIERLFVKRDRVWQHAPKGTFEVSMKKGAARINLNVVKHPKWPPFTASRFDLIARDWSHRGGFLARDRAHEVGRRLIQMGTTVVRTREIAGIENVIAAMDAAVDEIVSRSSEPAPPRTEI